VNSKPSRLTALLGTIAASVRVPSMAVVSSVGWFFYRSILRTRAKLISLPVPGGDHFQGGLARYFRLGLAGVGGERATYLTPRRRAAILDDDVLAWK